MPKLVRHHARAASIPRVLLVEDNADDVTLLRAFSEGRVEVTWCRSSDAAIEEINGGNEWDAILLDVHLPGAVDGWRLVELLKESRRRSVRTVIWTNGVSRQDKIKADGCQVRIVPKPESLEGYESLIGMLVGSTDDA